MVQDHIVKNPVRHHTLLDTTFTGIEHPLSTADAQIYQFRGIKYATIPARFRQPKLFSSYPSVTDATKYGPICPQAKCKTVEEDLFGLSEDEIPKQHLKQSEFECLNLNITCPAGLKADSHVPVMLWIHGGGDHGSGSNWIYDGGVLVRQSIHLGKPVMMVTFNYRLGLFGCAASAALREDNKAAGDEGVGNYGLRDQRKALEWVHRFIRDFGGDPSNVTLFGESSGAADIVAHLLSCTNQTKPLFHRAIIQSAIIDHNIPDVHAAGWHLSRLMSALHVSTVDQLRTVKAEELVSFGYSQNLRVTDDGVFLRKDWRDSIHPEENSHHHHHHHHHVHHVEDHLSASFLHQPNRSPHHHPGHLSLPGNLQPLIIGDCSSDSLLWSLPTSLWTSAGVVRRIRAVCQSLSKASALLRAYDISPYTPQDEIVERVLELVNDARISWPTECLVDAAKKERGGRGVWRYVFDQESPSRGIPHHAADLVYLFDNIPLPTTVSAPPAMFYEGSFDCDSDDDGDFLAERALDTDCMSVVSDDDWLLPSVDEWSYSRVRDTLQERWISFAHGEAPWREDKVFVFGPEGETGERSTSIFEGRRRKGLWQEALEPLGMSLVQKIGTELSNGPPLGASKARF